MPLPFFFVLIYNFKMSDSAIKISGDNTDFVEKEAQKMVADIENRLKISVDFNVDIQLHNSRESYNRQLGRDTKDWEVANTDTDNNKIDILHPDTFEKESSHNKKEFLLILKHEISHLFINKLAQNKAVPKWLDEGLAMYLADQLSQYKKIGLYTEEDFLSKISTQHGWDQYSSYSAYEYACLFVDLLISQYSLNKIKELISLLGKNYYYSHFQKIFKKIFGKSIEQLEEEFINEIK